MNARMLFAFILFCIGLRPARAAAARGVLEGFYGSPWTWSQRRSFVSWMGERGFNLFVIAPKDEPLQRSEWRRPLPAAYVAELRSLSEWGRRRSVRIAWALSPVGGRPGSADVAIAVGKLRQALDAGAGALVLSFDDADPDGDQIRFANEVLKELSLPSEIDISFVPALYWGEMAHASYLKELAARLDSRFLVGWTGGRILSHAITSSEAKDFAEAVGHRLVLGDNYPVQDRLIDTGRLFLGPLRHRDAGVPDAHAAVVFNASPLAEASKLPLYTASDFLAHPDRYEPWSSWEAGIRALGGPNAASPLRWLARECSASWLAGPAPGAIDETIQEYWSGKGAARLRARLSEAARVDKELAALENRALRDQLRPWSRKLADQAYAALVALEMLEGRKRGDPASPAALSALALLRGRADENGAVVSDFALDRFLDRAEAMLRGREPAPAQASTQTLMRRCAGGSSTDCDGLSAQLAALASAPETVERAFGPEAAQVMELAPWIGILADSASASGGSLVWWRRMRARWRLAPLLISRTLLDRFFERVEASWDSRQPSEGVPLWMRVYARLRPRSFPARLRRDLDAYSSGDAAGLRRTLEFMSALPARLRRSEVRLAQETSPWVQRVADYGREGLWLLDRDPKGILSAADRSEWFRRRLTLRSLNGLESSPELRFWIETAGAWFRLPVARRPSTVDVIYNPLQPL